MIKAVIFDWINTLYTYENGLYPFSLEVLKYLKPKYKLGLVTLAAPGMAQRNEEIQTSGVKDYFDSIIIDMEKTSDQYRKSIQELGLQPQVCAVVDDRIGNIMAAQSIGCLVYWVTNDTETHEKGINKITSVKALVKFL